MADKVTQQPQKSSELKRQKPVVDLGDPLSLNRETAPTAKNVSEHIRRSDILRLQRTLGNQAVMNMLQRDGLSKKSSPTDEAGKHSIQEVSRVERGIVQRAVDVDGVPTELDPVTDATTISGLKDQYLKFQQNLIGFWDSYKLEHPTDEQALFQKLWGHYLEGLKSGSKSQEKLASVKEVNDETERTSKIDAPGYKSVLGVKSVPHPAAKPRTEEEQALADEMGVMRLQLADEAITSLKNLVEGFSDEFDKAINKVKENAEQANSKIPWYKFWAKRKAPNYVFWSGGKANKFVEHNHSPEDTIQLEMTMGKMAWLNGLGRDRNTQAPNAITAYTGENFQIWTALSERYALKAAAEAQNGQKWNFIGYMSDIAVDEQSVYNTIERPTITKDLGVDLDITWKLIDEDPQTKKLYIAMESKNRNVVIEEMKRRQK
ncbi:MAG: hypothetical protein ABI970_25755 [Chloroflexota bacterium]